MMMSRFEQIFPHGAVHHTDESRLVQWARALRAVLRESFTEPPPKPILPIDYEWVRVESAPPFATLTNGKNPELFGQLWRRWNPYSKAWQYRQDPEPQYSIDARIW